MFIHSINGTQGYFKLYPSCLYQYRQQHKEHNSKQLAVLHFCNSYNCCPSLASWYQQQWQVLLSNTVHWLWLSSGYLQHDLSLIRVSAKQTFHNNINNLQSLLRVTGDTALEEKQREEWNLEGLRGKKKPRSKNCLCLSLADAESKTSVALWKATESTGLVTMTVTMKEKIILKKHQKHRRYHSLKAALSWTNFFEPSCRSIQLYTALSTNYYQSQLRCFKPTLYREAILPIFSTDHSLNFLMYLIRTLLLLLSKGIL